MQVLHSKNVANITTSVREAITASARETATEVTSTLTGVYHQNTAEMEDRIINRLMNVITQKTVESPSQKLFQMLMSKPDLLRIVQDELGDTPPDSFIGSRKPVTSQKLPFIRQRHRENQIMDYCGCRSRRRRVVNRSPWSIFTYFDESIVEYQHEIWCPRYHQSQVRQQRTKGVSYTGFCRILNVTLVASFTRTIGAGGASISPLISYIATVERRKAVSFRITDSIISQCHGIHESYRYDEVAERDAACRAIIDHGVSKLSRLFSRGYASPTDIDEFGWSIMGRIPEYRVR